MIVPVRLVPIPKEQYNSFRRKVIFSCHKWDPQVGDTNTISDQIAVISQKTAQQLCQWAEQLAAETMKLEKELIQRPDLYHILGLPKPIQKALVQGQYNPDQNIRLMRFDFHPTVQGWAVSEVNSDVPGGLAEASQFNKLAATLLPDYEQYADAGKAIMEGFIPFLPEHHGIIAFVYATSYTDDRQVMDFLSEVFARAGFKCLILAPDHLHWGINGPVSIAVGQEGPVDGLVRFFPSEWLRFLPSSSGWQGFFRQTVPACNHPAAILTQSKRLPLVWRNIYNPTPTWQELLPETTDPRKVKWRNNQQWILKPAFGRVGGNISIPEAINLKEQTMIYRMATFFPNQWVAQRRFISLPLHSNSGDRHLCIGVFTVNGNAAGFYGRLGTVPRIDERAQDIAVLVERKDVGNDN